ncbi:MAG: NPCBM/NEW2 domain-containing protein [Bacteroidaceae bacterium]|nr:NPCBM/NEW2 domain-containing protein [Bacteroidaceae bacterium]
MKKNIFALMMMLLSIGNAFAQDDIATFRTWAMTPPMGWNSWDCYFSSVTEKEVMQNAQYLIDNDLVKHGWEYVVIDIRWYCNHPSLGGGWYNDRGDQEYVLDEYGRYLPSPKRFPSCMVDGVNVGFKPLADRLHAMGLKLGIHLMRGVPRNVVGSSYKLKGSESTPWSQVYNGTTSPCGWLKDNLLVRNNTYGQLYYNSIMDLYAEWGVDFLKIDDLSRPFYTDEIHMIRKAIDQTGRPIVLSLSPGKTQFQYADECLANANMWRMMDDLWDNWGAIDAVFNEANFWAGVSRPGNWADCDMLPLGHIAATIGDPGYTNADAGHWTNLTHDEQYTMMTLWGMCHSPLFFGGEMTKNDAFTLSLMNNDEYHQMHKYSVDNRELYREEDLGHLVWTATDPATGNKYLALFQRDNTSWIVGNKALYRSETVAYTTDGHAVNVDIPWPEGKKTLVLVVDDGGDNFNYDHGDWINPTLILRDGTEVPLTGTYKTRDFTNSYFNRVYENRNVDHGGKMKVLGTTYDRGFSTDANAAIFFQIPEDMDVVRFTAMAAADDSGIGQNGSTTSIRFYVFDQNPLSAEQDDAIWRSGLINRTGTKSKQLECDITGAQQLKIVVSDWGDGFAYDRADFVNPVLVDAEGNETSLTTLTAASYTSDWGNLHINKNVENGTLRIKGRSYAKGLGMNAKCTLIYDLPEGHTFTTLRGLVGYDSSCDTDNTSSSGTTMEFLVYITKESPSFDVDLTLLGYGSEESVPVYDIWAKEDLGPAVGILSAKVPSHGARLFRLGDNVVTGIEQAGTDRNGTQPNIDGIATDAVLPADVYTLNGTLLKRNCTRIAELPKGIYMIGGSKLMVK